MTLAVCVIASTILFAGSAAAYSVQCRSSGIGCIASTGYPGTSVWRYPVNGTGNNCTNYAAFRLKKAGLRDPGNLGHAGLWAGAARRKGFRVSRVPAVGAIAQWNFGSSYASRRACTAGTSPPSFRTLIFA